MAGLAPAIHAFASESEKDVDARAERGHDLEMGVVAGLALVKRGDTG
jgi:hypothetical protein